MKPANLKSEIQKPFTFSQSSLQDYADCPRRFQLRYMEQLRWPAVESEPVIENEHRQIEGQIFHRMIQQNLLGLPRDSLLRLANTPNLVRWWDNFNTTDFGFIDYAQYAEISLSCPVGDHRLLAKYDLIAVKPGEKALIVDWKTYAKRPHDEWMAVRWQTRVYPALLVMAGAHLNNNLPLEPEKIEMIYWYADYPSNPTRFSYDKKQFKRDWSAIEKIVSEISDEHTFALTEDLNTCRFCTYRSYCERGTQAGNIDEAEAESESDPSFDVNFEQIGEIEF
jgi:CRISPR/Cas system-associated exonuclease Cas4 (RecB family)